jgi:hypothetical protein
MPFALDAKRYTHDQWCHAKAQSSKGLGGVLEVGEPLALAALRDAIFSWQAKSQRLPG